MKSQNYKNWIIHHFEKVDSTNRVAFELAQEKKIFANEIILTDEQDSGRGRLNRVWQSPKGNLYFSFVLQPQGFSLNISDLSFVAIIALRLAIQGLSPKLTCQNKWPNDLIIDGKKIAGILLENKSSEFVIVGIGVNIDSKPDKTNFTACSLKDFNITISPQNLLEKFLDEFERLYSNWLNFGFSNIRNAWLSKAYKLKEEIVVNLDNEKISGIFVDINEDGSLILETKQGVKKIFVADVS